MILETSHWTGCQNGGQGRSRYENGDHLSVDGHVYHVGYQICHGQLSWELRTPSAAKGWRTMRKRRSMGRLLTWLPQKAEDGSRSALRKKHKCCISTRYYESSATRSRRYSETVGKSAQVSDQKVFLPHTQSHLQEVSNTVFVLRHVLRTHASIRPCSCQAPPQYGAITARFSFETTSVTVGG